MPAFLEKSPPQISPFNASLVQSENLMQERSPDISLSKATYEKLVSIIKPYIRAPTDQHETPAEEKKRELNGLISALRDNVHLVDNLTYVQTPEELAQAIINFKEGKGSKPDAFCVPLTLLTCRILEFEEYKDPAILVFHPINNYGREFQRDEEVQGHTTATIVVKGLLVDPAMQTEVKTIRPIVLDPSDKGYSAFVNSVKTNYAKIFDSSRAVEFSLERGEDQIKSRFLLEQGNRTRNSEYILDAANLNPSNFYASIRAGDINSQHNDAVESINCYFQAPNSSPNSYLANYGASLNLINNWESLTDNEKQLTINITLKAVSLQPDLFLPSFQLYRLARKLGNVELSADARSVAISKLPKKDGSLTKEEKGYWALIDGEQ